MSTRIAPGIKSSSDHTAILFFSHRPEREWQNKWFVPQDYQKSRRVAEAFYERSRRAVEDSALPVLEVNGAEQCGGDFGTRLANAIADAFAQGYEHVIAVGSDCPRLHEVNWDAVAARLARDVPVLGPTADGEGTYLIGVPRAQFEPAAFAALPWKSPELFPALERFLAVRSEKAPAILAVRDDVNGLDDLVSVARAATAARSDLAAALASILGASEHGAGTESQNAHPHFFGRRSRAPPVRPKCTALSS